MSIAKNFKDAIKLLNEMLEVDNIAVIVGTKIKFSNFNKKDIKKIVNALQTSYNNVGFDFELQQMDIIDEKKSLKIFLKKDIIIIIKFHDFDLINESVLDEKVKTVLNFI
ncbi:MAG: hypothetical protein ACTSO9_01445 [Candidatus Helarchaeota archaeon]